MKILQVTSVDFALKKFLFPLIDEMKKQGFNVHIACNKGENAQEYHDQYTIHHIPFTRNYNMMNHLLNVGRLVKLMRKEQYDVVHAHTPLASLVARLAAKIAGVGTIVYTAHGFYFHEHMNPYIYKVFYGLEKIWGKYFTHYIFLQSMEDYQLALENQFNNPERIYLIGNGVSAEKFDPQRYDRTKLRAEMGLNEKDIVIMFVGRLVKEKGISELVKACEMIHHQGYYQVKLVLVGGAVEGDRDRMNLDELMTTSPLKLHDHLHILGLRSDIPQLLSICDIFTLPSYREGLPRSIIEAMAMGKPIIATNIRGCREEVIPGENGYLCEVQNSQDLDEKLLRLIESPNKRNRFGLKSREVFLQNYDEQLVLERQLAIFKAMRKRKENSLTT